MNKLIVAVDIEKAGPTFDHPIVSVGFVVGTLDKVLEKKQVNFKINWDTDFDYNCKTEFWDKLPPTIVDSYKENAEDPEYGWANVNSFLTSLEIKYPDHKLIFATDNASFDIAHIDYNLYKYVKRKPMRYSTTEKYRSVIAVDDMLDMISGNKSIKKSINEEAPHDHNVLSDAMNIYLQGQYILNGKYSL
jgi:hypothetical protein